MVFEINGVNILPYVAYDGLKYKRSDLDGPNAGRTMDGIMHRDRIAIKDRWDVTCRLLTTEEVATVMGLIEPEYVEVRYTNLRTNSIKVGTFYSNNIPIELSHAIIDGVEYWKGLAFPLVEK